MSCPLLCIRSRVIVSQVYGQLRSAFGFVAGMSHEVFYGLCHAIHRHSRGMSPDRCQVAGVGETANNQSRIRLTLIYCNIIICYINGISDFRRRDRNMTSLDRSYNIML